MPKQKFLLSIILTALFVTLLGGMQCVNAEWVKFGDEDVNYTHFKTPTSLWDSGSYDWDGRKTSTYITYKKDDKGNFVLDKNGDKIEIERRYGYKIRDNTVIYRYSNPKAWKFYKEPKGTILDSPIIDTTWGVYCIEHSDEIDTGTTVVPGVEQNIVVDDFNVVKNGKASNEEKLTGEAMKAARLFAYIGTYSKSHGPGPAKDHNHLNVSGQFAVWRNCEKYMNYINKSIHVDDDFVKKHKDDRRRFY